MVDGYYTQTISLSHLLLISRLKNEDMLSIYEIILSKNLKVYETELLVREKIFSIKSEGKKIDNTVRYQLVNNLKKLDSNLDIQITQTQVQTKIELKLKEIDLKQINY